MPDTQLVDAPAHIVHAPSAPVSLKVRLINLGAVIIPFAGVVAAMILLWGVAFDLSHLIVFLAMILFTGLGITVGYHRLFTHRSFDTPRPMAIVLAALGSMAVQGPLLEWVAVHRRHHQHSDGDGDPHSPHQHGEDFRGIVRGLWHAHIGWMFQRGARDLARYVGDLRKDVAIRRTSRLFLLWVVLGLAIPAVLGGVLTGSWIGVLVGFVWGGLARIFIVHHITWSINSVCHIWGAQPYANHDESRNNVVFGWLGFGEGWHNNHHAFPNSARHGLRWWQFDLSYLVIQGMALVGLARNIRVPHPDRMLTKAG